MEAMSETERYHWRLRVLSYNPPWELLGRICLKLNIGPAVAGDYFRELLKYLLIIARYPDRKHAPPQLIDLVWQQFVNDEATYRQFLDRYLLTPVERKPVPAAEYRESYANALRDYWDFFNEWPSAPCWPAYAEEPKRTIPLMYDVMSDDWS